MNAAYFLTLFALSLVQRPSPLPQADALQEKPALAEPLDVMTWNIWHGGREDGAVAGPQKVASILRESGADLIAVQETYGSGEILSEELGFHFHPRGTNVSILSRYPVLEDLSVHEAFQCVGALIELPGGERVAFYGIWLPYSGEIWQVGTRDESKPDAMRAACKASEESLGAMWKAIEARVAEEGADVPILIAGDFNSMSHLDYGEVGFDQYGMAIPWPTGRVLSEAGFLDAYREANPVIDRARDATWTPRFPRQSQDRIDFVYYRAPTWLPSASSVLRTSPGGWPSDHAAVQTTFVARPVPESTLRAAAYNIKHGLGMDGELDLGRTSAALARLDADIVTLQEVDLATARCGHRNQVLQLADDLDMHPAFGSFMDYDGGLYGMATLSRHPITRVDALRLPDGSEPRVALCTEVELPGGQRVIVVNVHFDWVRDDGPRFAQATVVCDYLKDLQLPWLLLGDFNDGPDSRTLELFRDVGVEVPKPAGNAHTFPADDPTKEIDFIFHSRSPLWGAGSAEVIAEPVASDHRPVATTLRLAR